MHCNNRFVEGNALKKLIEKYKDVIPYLIFGVLTTLVNIISYWVMAHPLKIGVMVSTVIAWVLSVLFAYVTNRKWVFHSEAETVPAIVKEMVYFFGCRLATGLLDMLIMYVFAVRIQFDDTWVKIFSNVIVVILNYLASKLLIFRHNRSTDEK